MALILGIIIALYGVLLSSGINKNAEDYERAEAEYQAERAALEARIRALS